MASDAVVVLTVEATVATITLNRPANMNAFNGELVTLLLQTLTEVSTRQDVKVVVLTGAGKAFTAGGDIDYLASLTDVNAARSFIQRVGTITAKIMAMEKPVIAMVNGVAAGAGFNLALACDLVFCADTARFAQSFAKVGLVPDCGGLYLLPRIVGPHKAKELMFSGELINADTALELRLVNRVVAAAELSATVYDYAKQLAQGAPLALGLIKSMVNRSDKLDLETSLEFEADLQAVCMQTSDHQEGINAFKAKRSPCFNGK